jgi:ribosome-binding ATPase YchF (GTP1/OBG family)
MDEFPKEKDIALTRHLYFYHITLIAAEKEELKDDPQWLIQASDYEEHMHIWFYEELQPGEGFNEYFTKEEQAIILEFYQFFKDREDILWYENPAEKLHIEAWEEVRKKAQETANLLNLKSFFYHLNIYNNLLDELNKFIQDRRKRKNS